MGDPTNRIGKILGAVKEAQALLEETMTPDIEKFMTPEQMDQLAEARKMTGVDLKKASMDLEKINSKYKK